MILKQFLAIIIAIFLFISLSYAKCPTWGKQAQDTTPCAAVHYEVFSSYEMVVTCADGTSILYVFTGKKWIPVTQFDIFETPLYKDCVLRGKCDKMVERIESILDCQQKAK